MTTAQRTLHDADAALGEARRALGHCQAGIPVRPLEAARQPQLAADAIVAAHKELLALFDERVARHPLYGA